MGWMAGGYFLSGTLSPCAKAILALTGFTGVRYVLRRAQRLVWSAVSIPLSFDQEAPQTVSLVPVFGPGWCLGHGPCPGLGSTWG